MGEINKTYPTRFYFEKEINLETILVQIGDDIVNDLKWNRESTGKEKLNHICKCLIDFFHEYEFTKICNDLNFFKELIKEFNQEEK